VCFSDDGTMQTVCKILPKLKQGQRIGVALGPVSSGLRGDDFRRAAL
jgi:hypothetical protein